MATDPKAAEFEEFADQILNEEHPRTLVILIASKADAQLRELLEAFLLPTLEKADQDELFDGDVPLGTFSSRIKLSARLGLFDADFRKTLEALRKIRNGAAHWVSFGVGKSPLRDLLRNLYTLVDRRRSFRLTVERYFNGETLTDIKKMQAVLLTICVLLGAVQTTIEKKSIRKKHKSFKLD